MFSTTRAYLTLDLLSALAILAVILCISVPSLSGMMRELNLRKESQKINNTIESLVTKAARDSKQFTLVLENSGMYAKSNSNPSDTIIVRTLPKRYRLEFLPVNKEIHFYKQGTCSPASFHLSNGDKRCTFTISLRCRNSLSCRK